MTGVFAESKIATMSGGSPIRGGWVDGHVNENLTYRNHLSPGTCTNTALGH